ncbi:thermonuclease family protein [Sphingobacterium thalpophilum]|uniref:thermonuclease family protein n=1 Tax=Sphingobacterium thalpophilum TaxID=259 RepID=UPI003C73A5DF
MKKWINIGMLLFLMSCGRPGDIIRAGFVSSNKSMGSNGLVYKVIDGDTFWIKNHQGINIKIRLIGIDAPEDRNAFHKKKHPFGKTSKRYLDSLILHKQIRLEYDVDSLDRYGRTLAYAYLDDIFINAAMIKNGFALLMTVPPNVRYQSQLVVSQKHAKENHLGLWALSYNPEFD